MLFTKKTGVRYIIVEGNIGAGKSTLLRILSQVPNVHVVYEPIDSWQAVGGSYNLLDKFYADPVRWAYSFQTYAFITRVLAAQNAIKNNVHPVQILERSVYSDRYCFAQNAYEMGLMKPLEWSMYTTWFDWLVVEHSAKPDGFIYMKTTPQRCFERMKKRNRSEESPVSLDYLQKIHTKHEDWLDTKINYPSYLSGVPVLSIDCDQEFEADKKRQQEIIQEITTFFPII